MRKREPPLRGLYEDELLALRALLPDDFPTTDVDRFIDWVDKTIVAYSFLDLILHGECKVSRIRKDGDPVIKFERVN